MAAMTGLSIAQCQSARLSRDARFDGRFFVAVKTTGIFCRPICPANLPHEANVEYFTNQAQALQSGYRPCLRCRPDSAPGSWAWRGVETTFQRAVSLIDQGDLQGSNLPELADRLGISDRYLRQLFQKYLGMSPKQYAQYQQLMFAKQLLHSSNMSIGEIAIASGFNSVRRFNDAFQKKLKLTPRDTRKATRSSENITETTVSKTLRLSYREPFNWDHLLAFYRKRAVRGVEEVGENYYARTFVTGTAKGWFRAQLGDKSTLEITFDIDDMTQLKHMVSQIRRMLDLDADIAVIEQHLKQTTIAPMMGSGIRIPGVWSVWEAGVRAIFGQQVSIVAAITMLNRFVDSLDQVVDKSVVNDVRKVVNKSMGSSDERVEGGSEGGYEESSEENDIGQQERGETAESHRYFPTPKDIANADLSVLKMPKSRKDTLQRFAAYMVDYPDSAPEEWLALKGIGPWTVSYAKLRGLSQPDCFLSTDLVIKKAMNELQQTATTTKISPNPTEKSAPSDTSSQSSTSAADLQAITESVSPWGSYATFNCWNSQS